MRRILCILVLILLCSGWAFAEEASPYAAYLAAAEREPVLATKIIQHGETVLNYYRPGTKETRVLPFNSCTKSMTSCLLGMLWDQALLDLEAPIGPNFPRIADDPVKSAITIRQLLNFTSGLEWLETTSWNGGFGGMLWRLNWVNFILDRPVTTTPGKYFNYNTGSSHLLSAIFSQIAGESMEAYAKKHLFGPLGMESVKWRHDLQGITSGGFGIEMTVDDAAKFGMLYLNRGQVDGKTLVSEAWIDLSTSKQSTGSSAFGQYGYHWWLRKFPLDPPVETFFAMGYAGQYIMVIPSLDAVIVMACEYGGDESNKPLQLIQRHLLPALQESA